jgi:hypothetical protein
LHFDCDETLFRYGMIRVGIRYRQRITKHARRFLECDPVLPAILSGFAQIPLKIHNLILPRRRAKEQSVRGWQ